MPAGAAAGGGGGAAGGFGGVPAGGVPYNPQMTKEMKVKQE